MMGFLKDTKFVVSFLVSIACAGYAAGSKTNSVSRSDFEKHAKAISTLEEKSAVHEQHDRDTDDAIKDLRETNGKIYQTVIDIARAVGVQRK